MMGQHHVFEPVRDTGYATRFTLEVFEGGLSPILYQFDHTDYEAPYTEMFVELSTLVEIGKLAERLMEEGESDTP